MHCITSQVSTKGKTSTCMHILDMLHYLIILITFLLYLFNWGDVHESFIPFKSEKLKVKVLTRALKNIHDTNHG